MVIGSCVGEVLSEVTGVELVEFVEERFAVEFGSER
jgi:hypothetical protein